MAYILRTDPLPRLPHPDSEVGLKGQNSTFFSEYDLVTYGIKWNHNFSNMVAHILHAALPTPFPRVQKVKIQLFSEQCHVANQIKGNYDFCNMVANVFPQPPPPLTMWVKRSKDQNKAIVHTQLKGITNATTLSQIFWPTTDPWHRG